MRLGRLILTFVLCLLWFGMPVHCELEAVSTASLFYCADDAGCCDAKDKGCTADFCNSLESGKYFPQKSFSIAKLPLGPVLIDLLAAEFLLSVPQERPASSTDTVPLLATSWHFVQRVAAPPRAPSLLS
jgi:hypothetical protein